jgi:hypothetical protein
MAHRPVFVPRPASAPWVETRSLEFQWFAGFSLAQKQRSIAALHAAAQAAGLAPLLEISTKSPLAAGQALSAFNLRLSTADGATVTVEAAFQGGKVFECGGPYSDLFSAPGRAIKRDPRLKSSGALVAFEWAGVRWPLEPRTAFYDWLYLQGLRANPALAEPLLSFAAFTDIEFNPAKSLNCQAHTAALYVALSQRGLLTEALASQARFIQLTAESINTVPDEIDHAAAW